MIEMNKSRGENMELDKYIEKVLVSQEKIEAVTQSLGEQITKDYKGKNPLVVGLLKGCIPFISDLIKYIDTNIELDFMDVSSYYGGIESTADVRILKDLSVSIKNRQILIAEDIVDSGRTLNSVIKLLKYRGAKNVKVVTLLNKPEGRLIEYVPDYIGVAIPKVFVVGYGLDYKEQLRNLPYVGVLKPEIYKNE
jgi:hypoxanthine phosphoribosyltransferase/bifunctional protein TilS/HprT